MTAQNGNDFILKMDISSTLTTLAGGTGLTFSMNGEIIDVTNKDSNGQRTLIAGGLQSADVSLSAVFVDDATFRTAQTAKLAHTIESFEVILPGATSGSAGTYAFSGIIDTMEISGEKDSAVTYSLTIKSSGAVTFTDLV